MRVIVILALIGSTVMAQTWDSLRAEREADSRALQLELSRPMELSVEPIKSTFDNNAFRQELQQDEDNYRDQQQQARERDDLNRRMLDLENRANR